MEMHNKYKRFLEKQYLILKTERFVGVDEL